MPKDACLTLDSIVKGGLVEGRNVGVDGTLKTGLHRVRNGGRAKAVERYTVCSLCIITIVLSS